MRPCSASSADTSTTSSGSPHAHGVSTRAFTMLASALGWLGLDFAIPISKKERRASAHDARRKVALCSDRRGRLRGAVLVQLDAVHVQQIAAATRPAQEAD